MRRERKGLPKARCLLREQADAPIGLNQPSIHLEHLVDASLESGELGDHRWRLCLGRMVERDGAIAGATGRATGPLAVRLPLGGAVAASRRFGLSRHAAVDALHDSAHHVASARLVTLGNGGGSGGCLGLTLPTQPGEDLIVHGECLELLLVTVELHVDLPTHLAVRLHLWGGEGAVVSTCMLGDGGREVRIWLCAFTSSRARLSALL